MHLLLDKLWIALYRMWPLVILIFVFEGVFLEHSIFVVLFHALNRIFHLFLLLISLLNSLLLSSLGDISRLPSFLGLAGLRPLFLLCLLFL